MVCKDNGKDGLVEKNELRWKGGLGGREKGLGVRAECHPLGSWKQG